VLLGRDQPTRHVDLYAGRRRLESPAESAARRPLLLLAACGSPEVLGGPSRELFDRSRVVRFLDHSAVAIETLPQVVTVRPERDPMIEAVTLRKERLDPAGAGGASIGPKAITGKAGFVQSMQE
jgi:hypothetical protein